MDAVNYFYRDEAGHEHGPFSPEAITALAKAGRLLGATVRTDRDTTWRTLDEVTVELRASAAPAPGNEGMPAVFTLLLIVALGALGFAGWSMFERSKATSPAAEGTAPPTTPDVSSPDSSANPDAALNAPTNASELNSPSVDPACADRTNPNPPGSAAWAMRDIEIQQCQGNDSAPSAATLREQPFCEGYAEQIVGVRPEREPPPCSNIRATLIGVCTQIEPSLYGPSRGAAVTQLDRLRVQYERISDRYSCMTQQYYPGH